MALLKVLLLLLLGVSVNSDVSLQKRIIGGRNCDNTEHLYHVRLENIKDNIKYHCGGSLIQPQWILTSARCWKRGWTNIVMLKVHPRTVIQYNQVIRHDPMIYTENGQQHDIALLKLETPVTDVPLALLPDCRSRLTVGDYVHLAGEGATTTGPNNRRLTASAISSYLQCVDMNVLQVSVFLPSCGHVFLAVAPNKDVCYGDIGGAAMHNGKIYGVISFGGKDYACQKPTAILDVCKYKQWIRRII